MSKTKMHRLTILAGLAVTAALAAWLMLDRDPPPVGLAPTEASDPRREPDPGPSVSASGPNVGTTDRTHVESSAISQEREVVPRPAGEQLSILGRSESGAALSGECMVVGPNRARLTGTMVDGRATFDVDPETVRLVRLSPSGHAAVTIRRADDRPLGNPIEITAPTAGLLRVRLLDGTGARLRFREIEVVTTEFDLSQRWEAESFDTIDRRRFATTDEHGIADVPHVPPGMCSVLVPEWANWQATEITDVQVFPGERADVTVTVPAYDETYCARALVDLADLPRRDDSDRGPANPYLFVEGGDLERFYRIDENKAVAVVRGEPGELLTARLGYSDRRGRMDPTARRSRTFVLTVGATRPIEPDWIDP